ncbi:TolB-like protein [Edaphobacter aggregans]|uniref:TolB-like protein n=1 Tax=Edaphobacter aggregans TaxID=570835 RepID=A0A3R9P8D6_9BACT|nr:tetratricopeptide repeat protein [Edaphobacter aggregans]RSL15794.1 TolB-like protein [Edaphobacter aggregans]
MNAGEKQVPTPPLSSKKSLANSAADPVPATAVRGQLARVVNSPSFVSSVRLCRFLTHIVNRTIDGDIDSLKEFSIAMEVFDRTSKYDPNIDAIVRVEARRLRGKLKSYYEEGQGTVDPVLIGLRPGSYVPVFRWLDAQPAKHREEIGAAPPPGRICVAVLPFVNMSPEPEQDYFCDGISEEITNSLTRVSGLNVIARTSAFHFKGANIDIREVGQRLGANLVIEGSVRKAGEQLRITAQAIQTESGHHVWSETFRRELQDVFAIQEEIAQSVADLLRLHMPEVQGPVRPSPPDLDAYTRYLQARFLIHQQSPETLHAALEQLRSLTETYPDYALAYSGMAAANGLLAQFGIVSGHDVYPEVKSNAERGYALDPESGATCTVLGALRAWFEHRWDEAGRMFDCALKLQPSHAPAHMFRAMALLCQGDIKAAESGLRRSTELDPLSASDCARMAYLHYVKGDYPSAEEHLRKSFELDRDYPEARLYEGLLHFQQERYDMVIQCLSPSASPLDIGLLAASHALEGSLSRAEECIERLHQLAGRQYVTPLAESFAAVGMGDFDLALQCLDEAINHKTNFVNLLAIEPFFHPLHTDRRFAKLLKKLNLPH